MSKEIADRLLANMRQFTGTEQYYRLNRKAILTDGTKYLATEGGCFWLMDMISSHLLNYRDTFAVATLERHHPGDTATFKLDDGNGNIHATQEIEYTDFPLDSIKLFAVWDSEQFVIMLTSEY